MRYIEINEDLTGSHIAPALHYILAGNAVRLLPRYYLDRPLELLSLLDLKDYLESSYDGDTIADEMYEIAKALGE